MTSDVDKYGVENKGMGKMQTADRGLCSRLNCGPEFADQWVKCGLKVADLITGMRNSIFYGLLDLFTLS